MPASSQATVLFFSLLQDLTGTSSLEIDLAPHPDWTVSHLLQHLYQLHPDLQTWDHSLLVAINQEYASRDQSLKNAREIAIMPPVQGG